MIIQDLLSVRGYRDFTNIAISTALSQFAVWINDVTLFLNNAQGDIPSPLLGFHYNVDGELDILRYQTTNYPYLNKSVTSNGAIKQTNSIKLQILSVITRLNSYPRNFLKMMVLTPYLERYVARGGLFTIVTPSYVYKNCQLERFFATNENDGQKGVSFRAEFKQAMISLDDLNKVSKNLTAQRIEQGAVPL